jgi:hypothetical protein
LIDPEYWLGGGVVVTPRIPVDKELRMPDDKTKTRPQDAQRVNVHEQYEVNWWCDEFKCTPAELRQAVTNVGVMADKVRAEVNRIKGRK